MNKYPSIKKIFYTLGILCLMLGVIPVPVLGQVGQVFAQDEVTPEPPPAEDRLRKRLLKLP